MSNGSVPTEDVLKYFVERTSSTTGQGIAGDPPARYRLMQPDDAPAGNRHPLVVFLHGAGERGDDNRRQLKYLPEVLARPENRRRYPCFAVAPQCAVDDRWVDVDWSRTDSLPAPTATRSMRAVRAVVGDLVASLPIDGGRIYLTGISMGGFGAWFLACSAGDAFAAVAPICGGGDPHEAAALCSTPIWAVHGDLDDAVPVERSRQMIAAIRAAGGAPRYSELAGVGHASWTPAYDPSFGLLDWMFQQRR